MYFNTHFTNHNFLNTATYYVGIYGKIREPFNFKNVTKKIPPMFYKKLENLIGTKLYQYCTIIRFIVIVAIHSVFNMKWKFNSIKKE